MSEVERKLANAGVFAGMRGLEGLLNASEFWSQQPYGTRFYYGPGGLDYLHRSVLEAAIKILSEPTVEPPPKTFREELQQLINRYSQENGSNTPDFIIADYLIDCLRALDTGLQARDKWYDKGDGKIGIRVEVGSVTPPTIS